LTLVEATGLGTSNVTDIDLVADELVGRRCGHGLFVLHVYLVKGTGGQMGVAKDSLRASTVKQTLLGLSLPLLVHPVPKLGLLDTCRMEDLSLHIKILYNSLIWGPLF